MLRPLPILFATLALTACVKAAKVSKGKSPLSLLAGSEWAPDTSGSGEQFVAFKQNGEILGHGGCNRFFGTYEQNGQQLTIGPLASTRMACPDLSSEQAFMQKLQDARVIEATHLRLVLKGDDGAVLMTLRRRDWD